MASRKTSSSSERQSSTRSRAVQMKTLADDMTGLVTQGQAEQAVQTLLDLVGDISADIERISSLNSRYAALLFGRRSERLTQEELGQLALAFGATEEQAQSEAVQIPIPSPDASLSDEAPSDDDDTESKPRKKRPNHPGRTRLAADLRREVSTTKVNEDERACMHCHAPMSVIGYQKHERIEYVPAQIVVHEEHREKLVCKGCRGDATTAPRGQAPAVIGRGGASILAHLIESKCDDCQPIHRQADQFARLGWDVPSNTLLGYWKHGTELLQPVAQATESAVLGAYVVGIDDTRLDFLDECNRGRKKRGHLWCFANKGGMVSYAFTPSWDAQEVAPWISAAAHFVQVDDYKGYACEVQTPEGNKVPLVDECKRLGCGMHIRRRYHAAFKAGDLRAALPISYFKRLYKIEEQIRGLPPDARLSIRNERSQPILQEFDAWLKKHEGRFRPTEMLAEASAYHRQQLPYFKRCFTDGRFEIDNGDCERGIRRVAMGRRNWLFAGASTGGPRLATGYTLVQSCRRLGLPTRDYLVDVITKVEGGWPVRRVSELVPERWGIERGLLTLS
jgi:transposase